ncbi:MAG: hypothetical protein E6I38_11315, partial [Chloroflexi bacterium]
NREIYLANADGTGQIRLTNDPGPDLSPEWSPDGARLAFVGYRGSRRDIFVINVDGSGLVHLTKDESPSALRMDQ